MGQRPDAEAGKPQISTSRLLLRPFSQNDRLQVSFQCTYKCLQMWFNIISPQVNFTPNSFQPTSILPHILISTASQIKDSVFLPIVQK